MQNYSGLFGGGNNIGIYFANPKKFTTFAVPKGTGCGAVG